MRSEPDFLKDYEVHYSWHNMTTAEFFRRIDRPLAGDQPPAETDEHFEDPSTYKLNYAAPSWCSLVII